MKLGEFLIQNKKISLQELQEALQIQARLKKKKLGRLLVELGHLSQAHLNLMLCEYFKARKTDVLAIQEMLREKQDFPDELKKFAQKHKALLIKPTEDKIVFLKVNFFDDALLESAEKLIHNDCYCWVVSHEEFSFLGQKGVFTSHSQVVLSKTLSEEDKLNESSPYAKAFKEALLKAIESGASDIHIEPFADGVRIRFRIFGTLNTHKVLGKEHRESFISKIKDIVSMDLAIIGKPQDSRASFKSLKLDARANSLPNMYGEKIVLRLLDQERDFKLKNSGLSPEAINILRNATAKKDGLILISGPTGSGKTTTLYSLLFELPREKLNVSTLENPVEYQLAGINQVNIKDDGASTFENSLRALMRQDPDVILVGEIRDKETATLSFKAASTGHLVLSTVHANGAKEVVERLTNLGIDTFTIRNNLRLSAAQRLIPILCPKCSLLIDEKETISLPKGLEAKGLKYANVLGCSECKNGIHSRRAVLELMEQEEISEFLSSDKNMSFVLRNSLKAEIFNLIQKGKVDYKEAFAYI